MVEETDKGLFVTYAPESKQSLANTNKRIAQEDVINRKENKVVDTKQTQSKNSRVCAGDKIAG